MSTKTLASSDTWKFIGPMRIQRRAPLIFAPNPGMSTSSSSANPMSSRARLCFSHTSAGTRVTAQATRTPHSPNRNCLSRK